MKLKLDFSVAVSWIVTVMKASLCKFYLVRKAGALMHDASLLLLSTNGKHKTRFYECTASFKIKTNASTVKQRANSIKKIKIQFVGLKAAWMKTKVNQRYRWSARGARFLCCKSRASGKVRKKMVNSAKIVRKF